MYFKVIDIWLLWDLVHMTTEDHNVRVYCTDLCMVHLEYKGTEFLFEYDNGN